MRARSLLQRLARPAVVAVEDRRPPRLLGSLIVRLQDVSPATPFTIFATLYMTSFLLDVTEKWTYPTHALLALIAIPIFAVTVTKWLLLVFLVLSSLHYVTTTFPDLANHNNLFLVSNALLAAAVLYAASRHRAAGDDHELFEIVKAPLRVMLSVVYLFTGFHKLNPDFFDPVVGCAATFSNALLNLPLEPLARVRVTSGSQDEALPVVLVVMTAVFVLAWELGAGLALWLRRLQLPALFLCLAMHLVLAQIGFFDFSSLALALFMTFVPSPYWKLLAESPVRLGRIRLRRDLAYLAINVAAAIPAGVVFSMYGYREPVHRVQGAAFALATLVYLWPWLRQAAVGHRRVKWAGVPVWSPSLWKGWVVFPLFVVFLAMNPYLGLRTAGTFTMFSNLRTEGARSNHWLLASNPLKLWGYQEDVVEIMEIDRRLPGRVAPEGYLLPVVEFKKSIHEARRRGLEGVRAVYAYDGRLYETPDLVRDNPWNVRGRDVEMLLLDFRVIQKSPTPNRCRW